MNPEAQLKNSDTSQLTAQRSMPIADSQSNSAGHGCSSILIVDDDQFCLELTRELLAAMGYNRISIASDGHKALELLDGSETDFYIIVCDLNMPRMNGVEFIRQTRDKGFSGGIILLSGENPRMLETAYGVANAHAVNLLGALPKPVDPQKLKSLIEGFKPASEQKTGYTPQEPITETQLREGIEGSKTDQVLLVFQPKVEVKSGNIIGVETLARWWNKDRGILGPAAFIPLAEEKGLIDALTNTIFTKAVLQASAWEAQKIDLRAAINFSVNSFSSLKFCDFLNATVRQFNVDPQRLILEITETQAMSIPVDCLSSIIGVRLNGFGLSIDDFGTGNSSLAQLKNIPFTELKVDRAFVNGAAQNASSRAILEASISLARKLDMQVVAEGVETRDDWDLAEELGVDYVQGFYCARPMSNGDLLDLLQQWQGPHHGAGD
ncbi:MAG: EAL domain-containing response regulator [Gammaproteobacteria bacterium]